MARGIHSLTSRVSEYVEYHLQKYVMNIRSYLRDGQHLIELLKNMKAPPNLFARCDVVSLYTCIPHEEGLCHIWKKIQE